MTDIMLVDDEVLAIFQYGQINTGADQRKRQRNRCDPAFGVP